MPNKKDDRYELESASSAFDLVSFLGEDQGDDANITPVFWMEDLLDMPGISNI